MRRVYGRHPVTALLETRPESVQRLLVADAGRAGPLVSLARRSGIRVESAPPAKLSELAGASQHQGLVAEADEFPYADIEDVLGGSSALVLVLDSIQDPHNFGALIRSAECLGATGVVVAQDRAAGVTGVVAKASAGAVERIPVARVVNIARALERLKELGVWVTGLAGEAGPGEAEPEDLADVDFTGPSALVVGAEGEGLRPLVRRGCDRIGRIPMTGRTGSLNASVAGALALYEAASQRRRNAAKAGRNEA